MKKTYWIALVLLACGTSIAFWRMRRATPLLDTDYLLVGEVANKSGETVLDNSLREALRIALSQSPHLNLINDEKVRDVLRQKGKPENEAVTLESAKQVCPEVGAAAYLTGVVEHTNGEYQVRLNVNRCRDGSRLASSEGSAARPDLLIHQLGLAAVELRQAWGEDAVSVQKYNVAVGASDIADADSAEGVRGRAENTKGARGPGGNAVLQESGGSGFAIRGGRSGLAVSLYNLNQMGEAADNIREAYEAGDRQTARERLNISTLYYDMAQGDVEKAIEGYKEYLRI